MTWFFEDPAAIARFDAEWPTWQGTPFREFSQAKGRRGGVYCVGLAEAIHVACGSVRPSSFPHDSSDYQPHKAESQILAYLRGEVPNETSAYLRERFAELPLKDGAPTAELMHADLIVGRFSGFFHLPIVTVPAEGKFIHAVKPRVGEGWISAPPYAGQAIAHFRARAL